METFLGSLTTVATLVLAVAALYQARASNRLARITSEHSKTASLSARLLGTIELFNRFFDQEARRIRFKLYQSWEERIDQEKRSFSSYGQEEINDIEIVCHSINLIGLLVKNNMINENDAFQLYGDAIIRCKVILQKWIAHRRVETDHAEFEDFLWLANRAIEYPKFAEWREKGVIFYTEKGKISLDFDTSMLLSGP